MSIIDTIINKALEFEGITENRPEAIMSNLIPIIMAMKWRTESQMKMMHTLGV